MLTAVLLLFAHWVGDYGLQTNEMANNKATSIRWLTIHVLVYAVVLLLVTALIFPIKSAILFCLVNAGLHWLTDLCTGRLAARVKANPRHYYPVIGFDQFLHAASLLLTAEWVGRSVLF